METLNWRLSAACRDEPLERFFPITKPVADTVALCESCSVRVDCIMDALSDDMVGIWGGLGYEARKAFAGMTAEEIESALIPASVQVESNQLTLF